MKCKFALLLCGVGILFLAGCSKQAKNLAKSEGLLENVTPNPTPFTEGIPAEEKNEKTGPLLMVGDHFAVSVDESGSLKVLYDIWGRTEGFDFSKKYKGIVLDGAYGGKEGGRLIMVDEEGKPEVHYPRTAEEAEQNIYEGLLEAMETGGTYGGQKENPDIMRSFEELSNVRQMICHYPYEYCVLFEDGTVMYDGRIWEELQGVKEIALGNCELAGIMEDGSFVFLPIIKDLTRQKKLEEWPKLKQLCAGSYFVGLKTDGTVIAEDIELNYLINTIEQWKDIIRVAAAGATVVGLKADGTVVAVCSFREDRGQCNVDQWKDIVAVDTNGRITVGIKKDGSVVYAGGIK